MPAADSAPRPEPPVLWRPNAERIERAAITRFAREHGLPADYAELWQWSVDDIERFWAAIWEHFDVAGSYDQVLGSREMPGAEWFPGARLSYAEHIFRDKDAGRGRDPPRLGDATARRDELGRAA